MAVQDPYLQTDGDINQAKRRRAGDVPRIGDLAQSVYDPNPAIRNAQARGDAAQQFNAVNGLPAPTGPNPARARQMQEQYKQPVYKGHGPFVQDANSDNPLVSGIQTMQDANTQLIAAPGPAAPGFVSRAADYAQGMGQLTAGVVSAPVTTAIDLGRAGIAWLDGSELENPNAARDVSGKLMYGGVNNIGQAFDGSRGIMRDLIGARPARPSDGSSAAAASVSTPKPTDKPGSTNKPSAAAQTAPNAQPESEYMQTGIDGIAMRRGAGGVPEFTNDPSAVAGASPMPAGGVGTMGNGAGTFSQMNPGDSRLAIDRFERANQERARMIEESRRGQLGEGGGRLTVVGDNSWLASRRAPTLAERQRARLDERQADTEARRAGAQEALMMGADTRATNRLQRIKAEQDIASGAMELQSAQAVQHLRDMMADPSLSDAQRQSAMQSYAALTTPAKDRYILQDTVIASDPVTGPKYGKVAIDVLTGRPVAGGGSATGRTSVTRAEVEKTAKDEGMTVEQVSKMLRVRGITV